MQKQSAPRPVNRNDPSMNEVSADAPQLEDEPVSGHHGAGDGPREHADGELVDLAAGRYGGYGGLREPDSASSVEPPVIESEASGFDREYLEWRDQQLRSLDADYRSWRDEGHSRFTKDFASWRKSRDRRTTSGGEATSNQAETNKPSAPRGSSGNTG